MVQKYQETTYSLLYSKVGDTYGAGDGSTTFNLPDLQDEFIRGSSDTLPVGNKQDDEFKDIIHIELYQLGRCYRMALGGSWSTTMVQQLNRW